MKTYFLGFLFQKMPVSRTSCPRQASDLTAQRLPLAYIHTSLATAIITKQFAAIPFFFQLQYCE
jgi:hypothetical protein